jgi:hypothetical protein
VLLDLDEQLTRRGPAREGIKKIDASISRLQAVKTDASPGNQRFAESTRAIFDTEPIMLDARLVFLIPYKQRLSADPTKQA